MSTTGDVKVTEGSGKSVATYTISEDSETKSLQRIVICDPTGAEIGSVLSTAALSPTPSPVEVTNPSYEAVAASASAQVMGASGAAGDILSHVLIIPATTSPGAVSIQDGAGSAITIFAGGVSSVTSLIPFAVPLGIIAATNWKITTGANVSAVGVGKFS